MDERQRELDRRIRSAQRKMLLQNLWESRLLIVLGAFLLGALGLSVAWNSTPDRVVETLLATPVDDAGLQTTRKGSQYRHETVRFANGATLVIDIPGDTPIRHDAQMRIEVHEKDFGPIHEVNYHFAGYADEAPRHA